MLHLGFACNWTEPRSNTWSGIPHALYQALLRQVEIHLVDIDVLLPRWQQLYYTLRSLSKHPYAAYWQNEAPHSPARHRAIQGRFRQEMQSCSGLDAVLCISDIEPTPRLSQYLYFDLSIPGFREMLRVPELARVERVHYRDSYLQAREMQQKRVYEAARGLFAVSRFAAEGASRAYDIPHERLHVVGAGATATALESSERLHPKEYLLVVGKDVERKAIPLVLQAYARLREKADVDMVVIGPELHELSSWVSEGVHVLGAQPKDVVQRYFHHARLFVLPSYFEAYGLVFAEALVHGVPVVARNCCAMPEIIREADNGYLLSEHSTQPDELAALISKSLADTEMVERVRAQRVAAAQYYSWDRVAHDIVQRIVRNAQDDEARRL